MRLKPQPEDDVCAASRCNEKGEQIAIDYFGIALCDLHWLRHCEENPEPRIAEQPCDCRGAVARGLREETSGTHKRRLPTPDQGNLPFGDRGIKRAEL